MRWVVSILISVCSFITVNAQNLYVHVPEIEKEDNFALQVTNKFPCPITLTISSSKLDTAFQKFIPKNEKRTVFNWDNPPEELLDNFDQIFEYNFILGDPDVVHDDRYQYQLPYPKGEAYKLVQGNKSDYTHNEDMSRYAFDFAMPVGSLVSAARGGVVGYVVDKFSESGSELSLKEKTNRILICHDDGTVAVYAHLKQNGAFVDVGDIVYAGQVIGLSGNTGYSSFPHLHFAVLTGDRSIPIRFRNEYTILYEGLTYEHE